MRLPEAAASGTDRWAFLRVVTGLFLALSVGATSQLRSRLA